MVKTHATRIILLGLIAGLGWQSQAGAQIPDYSQTALDNASGSSVRARVPGDLVTAGVARAVAFSDAANAGVQITETSQPTSIRAQAIADSLEIVFQALNQTLVLFEDLWLAQLGDDSSDSSNTQSDSDDSSSTDDSTSSSGGRR